MSRYCSREGYLASPAGVLARLALGTILVIGGGMRERGVTISAAEEVRSEASKVRCPHCDRHGRQKCPECAGKGLLERDCATCSATGRRPCRACSSGDDAQSPGEIACSFCGGTGAVGDDGRVCPRCKGAQTIVCGTCLGKGWHPCRKYILDTVCPTCKFVGKVPCKVCSGELWLAPAVLKSREALKPTPSRRVAPRAARRADLDRPETRDGREESEAEAREEFDLAALRARFAAITPVYESHYGVFADDLRLEVSGYSDKVRALERSLSGLSGESATALRTELDEWQKRVRAFRRRWEALLGLFKKERQTYLNAERVWRQRDEAVKGLSGRRRELRDAGYENQLLVSTRIAETASGRLTEKQPETLLVEVEQLRTLQAEYEKRGELELALVAAAKAAAEEDAKRASEEIERSKASKRVERRPSRRVVRGREAGLRGASDRADRAAVVRGAAESRAETATVSERKRTNGKRESGSSREDAATPEPNGESGDSLTVLFALLVGFGIACSVFFLRGLWRQRTEY